MHEQEIFIPVISKFKAINYKHLFIHYILISISTQKFQVINVRFSSANLLHY